jgi:hypothetical protein
MKILGFPGILLILSGAAKTLAGAPPACEAEGKIGICVDCQNQDPGTIDSQCPYPSHDLYVDEEEDCPNEFDVSP